MTTTMEDLKKQIAEYEAVETYIMNMIKKGCKYEDVLKAHYREGKVVNGEWVDDDDDDDDDDDSEEYDSENDEQDFTSEELEKLNSQFPREMLVKLFNDLPKI